LCTFDFIQYNSEMDSFALSISSLFLFHSHIHLHLYILIYTYSFNLQSQKRIKKFFTVGFWTGLARLWIIFLVLSLWKKKRKKEYPNPHKPVPIRATRGLAGGLTINYVGCWSRFSNPFTAGRVVRNMQIWPAPTPI
jgi:hypothetical protein